MKQSRYNGGNFLERMIRTIWNPGIARVPSGYELRALPLGQVAVPDQPYSSLLLFPEKGSLSAGNPGPCSKPYEPSPQIHFNIIVSAKLVSS
jgi:hypothetical protein